MVRYVFVKGPFAAEMIRVAESTFVDGACRCLIL